MYLGSVCLGIRNPDPQGIAAAAADAAAAAAMLLQQLLLLLLLLLLRLDTKRSAVVHIIHGDCTYHSFSLMSVAPPPAKAAASAQPLICSTHTSSSLSISSCTFACNSPCEGYAPLLHVIIPPACVSSGLTFNCNRFADAAIVDIDRQVRRSLSKSSSIETQFRCYNTRSRCRCSVWRTGTVVPRALRSCRCSYTPQTQQQ